MKKFILVYDLGEDANIVRYFNTSRELKEIMVELFSDFGEVYTSGISINKLEYEADANYMISEAWNEKIEVNGKIF